MKTPDRIWLIDLGDEITWCDDPDPSGTIDESDTVEYVKASREKKLVEALENIVSNDTRSHFNRVGAMTLSHWAREALKEHKP